MLSIFVPSTGRKRICATEQFFPRHTTVPLTTPTDNVIIAAQKLITALKQPAHILEHNISKNHMTALEKISEIFKNATINKNNTTSDTTVEKQLPIENPTHHNVTTLPRPSTHRYPTRSRNGAHIIDDIVDTHAINLVLQAPIQSQHHARIYDSAWDINITPKPTKRTDTLKPIWSLQQSTVNPNNHYVCSVMDKDTGNLMSYPQLIKNPETEPRWSLAM